MKPLAIVALAAIPALVGSCDPVCSCPGPGIGFVVRTAAPITQVALSGSACGGGRFVCDRPSAPADTIPTDCTQVWIVPKAAGACIVDLTIGGTNMLLQHQMLEYPVCCGGEGETYFGDEDQVGFVDLRNASDAGDGGLDAGVD